MRSDTKKEANGRLVRTRKFKRGEIWGGDRKMICQTNKDYYTFVSKLLWLNLHILSIPNL